MHMLVDKMMIKQKLFNAYILLVSKINKHTLTWFMIHTKPNDHYNYLVTSHNVKKVSKKLAYLNRKLTCHKVGG